LGAGATVRDAVVRDAILEAGATVESAVVDHAVVGRRAKIRGRGARLNVGDDATVEV
jgi:glucose-1-phosphate thymidylyltransferase